MQKLYWLGQIKPEQRIFVGEKAFNLSTFLEQGYPVLPGFVISSSLLKEFVKTSFSPFLGNAFFDSSVDVCLEDYQTLKNFTQNCAETIVNSSLPPEWLEEFIEAAKKLDSSTLILRSSISGFHPLTGIFPAKICSCTPDSLASTIKLVWADFFDTKSFLYWQKQMRSLESVNFAILVQPIRDAIASGVVTIKSDAINIHSTYGLGFSLIRGQVKADSYRFDLFKKRVIKDLGKKIISYAINQGNSENYLEYKINENNDYSLDEETLYNLIELGEKISKNNLGTIDWTIIQGKKDTQKQIFLTKCNLSIMPSLQDFNKRHYQLLVKGVAASPGEVIAPARVMINLDSHSYPREQIIIARNLTPDSLNLIRHSKGIITEEGSITSHAAILARELGIPAVVVAKNATRLITSDDTILLNGSTGEIYKIDNNLGALALQKKSDFSNLFNYPIATKLLVNISQINSLNQINNLPIDGLGLFRSELMFLELIHSEHLKNLTDSKNRKIFHQKFTGYLSRFASAFYPRPIFYRFLDIRKDLPLNLEPKIPQYRGTYNYYLEPYLFDIQMEVLVGLQKEGYDNINLILPFVRTVEEVVFCDSRIQNLGGINRFPLWIMAEVPSVLFLLPEYVKAGVQGIAIGTNDLTELLLGSSRENSLNGLTANHPAVLTAIQKLITQANSLEIPCSICGMAPVQYPELIDKLIEWGITSISVELDAVVPTYNAIARAEQRLLLKKKR